MGTTVTQVLGRPSRSKAMAIPTTLGLTMLGRGQLS